MKLLLFSYFDRLCFFILFLCGCLRINCFESAPPRWHLLAWLPGAKRRGTRETRDTRHTSLTFIHHMCPNPQKSSETETGSPEVQHVSHDATLQEKILHKVLTFESLKKKLGGKKIQKVINDIMGRCHQRCIVPVTNDKQPVIKCHTVRRCHQKCDILPLTWDHPCINPRTENKQLPMTNGADH